jgi:hypothetical protein
MKQSLKYPYRFCHTCSQLQVVLRSSLPGTLFANDAAGTCGAMTPCSSCMTISGAGSPSVTASAPEQDRTHEAHMQVANGRGMLTDVATISGRHTLPDYRVA